LWNHQRTRACASCYVTWMLCSAFSTFTHATQYVCKQFLSPNECGCGITAHDIVRSSCTQHDKQGGGRRAVWPTVGMAQWTIVCGHEWLLSSNAGGVQDTATGPICMLDREGCLRILRLCVHQQPKNTQERVECTNRHPTSPVSGI